VFEILLLVSLSAPALLLAILGLGSFFGSRFLTERWIGVLVRVAFFASFLGFVGIAFIQVPLGISRSVLSLGEWFGLGEYHFELRFVIDRLSLTFALFTSALCGVVGAFAHRYLHREAGYNRFFILLALFGTGIQLVILADSMEVVFAGWEFVGISSSLLVSFFHSRPSAVENGMRAFIVYRISDVGILLCAVFVHHLHGTGNFESLMGTQPWPSGQVTIPDTEATLLCLLLLFSVMGKSAQIPFSGWLPRAMEGPTPSSAIFYGALSVHAGAYLLLRAGPLLDQSPVAQMLIVLVGLCTALYATFVGRAQTDIKSALAFASLTQVSIILVEIGLGFRYLALLHIVGHASIRSLQFLRAPSLLQELNQLERSTGEHASHTGEHYKRIIKPEEERRLYRFSLERGHVDSLLERFVVGPFLSLFRFFDRCEGRLRDFVSRDGGASPKALPEKREEP
jgi:NADH-quinone oxidoreductase subunit L